VIHYWRQWSAPDAYELQIAVVDLAHGLWVLPWEQDESSKLLDEREYAILEFLKNKKKVTSVVTNGQVWRNYKMEADLFWTGLC